MQGHRLLALAVRSANPNSETNGGALAEASMDSGRKREEADGAKGASAGAKRSQELESFQSGLGSKSKPCTKFFSTSGCPFGEGCHFLHYFPGGYQAVSEMTNLGGTTIAPSGRMMMDGPPTPTVKTRLCNKYNTGEGCKWGDKCHFAHGEWELGGGGTGSNFKTKMCENFAKGSCSFGNKCHFAHGKNELHNPFWQQMSLCPW